MGNMPAIFHGLFCSCNGIFGCHHHNIKRASYQDIGFEDQTHPGFTDECFLRICVMCLRAPEVLSPDDPQRFLKFFLFRPLDFCFRESSGIRQLVAKPLITFYWYLRYPPVKLLPTMTTHPDDVRPEALRPQPNGMISNRSNYKKLQADYIWIPSHSNQP